MVLSLLMFSVDYSCFACVFDGVGELFVVCSGCFVAGGDSVVSLARFFIS